MLCYGVSCFIAWRFCRAGRTSGGAARKIKTKLLPPQSPRGFYALARLYYLARLTKTVMLRRLVMARPRTSRFKKTWEVFLYTEDSLRRLYVERAKNTSAPLSQDGRSCLQASAIEKRFEKKIYTFRNPQKMKDKNAFFFRSEFRAFIIVMTFVAVSDTIGRIRGL